MPLFPPLGNGGGGGVRGARSEKKGKGKGGGGQVAGGVWESVEVPWKLEAARVKKKVCFVDSVGSKVGLGATGVRRYISWRRVVTSRAGREIAAVF